MPDQTDLAARMDALIDGASYDWETSHDAMRWRPEDVRAARGPALPDLMVRIDVDTSRATEAFRQIAEQFRAMGPALKQATSGLSKLGLALAPSRPPRSEARTARRAAGPLTRSERLSRKARRRELVRMTRVRRG